MWIAIQSWFLSLGAEYGVNPLIFGSIYVGAIPFFFASVAWAGRNRKMGRPVALPILCAGCCFVSAYVYLAIVGRNIPLWVWMLIAAMLAYGAVSTVKTIRRRLIESSYENPSL